MPQDIIFLILNEATNTLPPFDHLSHFEGERWDASKTSYIEEWQEAAGILSSLSQVSKDWHGTVIPQLYKRMRLRTESQLSNAAETLEHRRHHPCPWIGCPHGDFVRVLDIGDGRDSHSTAYMTSFTANIRNLVLCTPKLRSYGTSIRFLDAFSSLGSTHNSNGIFTNLLKNGKDLTTLEISDQKSFLPDIHRLINGLPALETFILCSMVMWELERSRKRTCSVSLKTLIIIEPPRFATHPGSRCLYGHAFYAMSSWDIPNIRTVLIHDCCAVSHVLENVSSLLLAHRSKIQSITFRRINAEFSEKDRFLFTSEFTEFANMHLTPTSVRFLKG